MRGTRVAERRTAATVEIGNLSSAVGAREIADVDQVIARAEEMIFERVDTRQEHIQLLLILGRALLRRRANGTDVERAATHLAQAQTLAARIPNDELVFHALCWLAVANAHLGNRALSTEILTRVRRSYLGDTSPRSRDKLYAQVTAQIDALQPAGSS